MASTKEIVEKWNQYFMPCCDPYFADDPMTIVRGKGAVVEDIEGKSYIDLNGGWGTHVHGHCHPKIVEAIKRQVEEIMVVPANFMAYGLQTALLAEKLAQSNKLGLKKSFFCGGGGEAVECATLLARKYTGKTEIVALSASYHGLGYQTRAMTGYSGLRKVMAGTMPAGVTFAPWYYCYRCFFGLEYPSCDLRCAKSIEEVIKFQTANNISAFIAEPILGVGGAIPAPAEYFKVVKKILDQHSILFIDDEIQAGYAKTGKMFAIEHYGVEPDIMTLSKAFGGGFPIAAVMAREEVANAFKPGDHFVTYGGFPLGCTAAIAALDVIMEENLIERAADLGRYFTERLRELEKRHDLIGDVRGKGLFIGVEFVKDRKTKEPAVEEALRIRYEMKKRGVLVTSGSGYLGNVMRILAPIVITREQIDKCIEATDASLKAV